MKKLSALILVAAILALYIASRNVSEGFTLDFIKIKTGTLLNFNNVKAGSLPKNAFCSNTSQCVKGMKCKDGMLEIKNQGTSSAAIGMGNVKYGVCV